MVLEAPAQTALGTIVAGAAVFLLRRRIARAKAARNADRAYDEEGLAWSYGFLGVMIGALGVVFLVIALR